MEPAFNEIQLKRLLLPLDWHRQLAFGAACCERVLPNYLTFIEDAGWGDPTPLRRGLDAAWTACMSNPRVPGEVQSLIVECEAIVPDSEAFESLYVTAAQDAVFATCSLLDFLLSKEISHLVNAARYPVDSLDLFIQEIEGIEPRDPDLELKILAHPLMQQELLRQKRDLVKLDGLGSSDVMAIERFRDEGKAEAAFVLQAPDSAE